MTKISESPEGAVAVSFRLTYDASDQPVATNFEWVYDEADVMGEGLTETNSCRQSDQPQ